MYNHASCISGSNLTPVSFKDPFDGYSMCMYMQVTVRKFDLDMASLLVTMGAQTANDNDLKKQDASPDDRKK